MSILEQITNYINTFKTTYDQTTVNILLVFLIISAFLIILRIILTANYQTQYLIFSIKSKKGSNSENDKNSDLLNNEEKPQVEKPNTNKSSFGLVSKVLNDCKKSIDKGVTNVNIESATNKQLIKLKFIFWSYRGMEDFVISFEQGIILIGVLLTLFLNNKDLYAITTISVFIVLKILGTLFNFKLIKEKLIYEIVEYVEQEIAVVDTSDMNSSISKLSKDIYVALIKQADIMKESIDKMGSNLTGALALSISEMTKAVESSVTKATTFSEGLTEPIELWSQSIKDANIAQEKISLASESLNDSIISFGDTSQKLSDNFVNYIDKSTLQEESIKDSINILIETIEELKQTNNQNKIDYEAVARQLKYIDKNQSILEQHIQQYEVTLESVTSNIGESLGEIVDLQMQNSYIRLNDILLENINIINTSNKDTLYHLRELFDDLRNQTKNQTQTIVNVKEQMDMQFDIIREKI